jgi:hypothetical protein
MVLGYGSPPKLCVSTDTRISNNSSVRSPRSAWRNNAGCKAGGNVAADDHLCGRRALPIRHGDGTMSLPASVPSSSARVAHAPTRLETDLDSQRDARGWSCDPSCT